MADTVKFASRIFSANQSTYNKTSLLQKQICFAIGKTYLASGIAKNNGLSYGQRIVQVAQSIELPFFAFNSDEKLFYSFQGQLITKNYLIIYFKKA